MAIPEPARDDIFAPGGHIYPESLSDSATRVLQESLRFARETRWDSLRSPHIFMGLLAVPDRAIQVWGDLLHADLSEIREQFQELFKQEEGESDALLVLNREFMSDNVIELLREAQTRAGNYRRRYVTPMDLLVTLLTKPNSIVAECFERSGITAAKLTELAVIAEQQAAR